MAKLEQPIRRSRLLQQTYNRIQRGVALSITARLVLSGMIVGGLLILALITTIHPDFWPFWPLYWIHDNVYLIIRGLLWTWPFPVSLVGWGTVLVLIILAWVSFLTDGALLRTLHEQATRAFIRTHPLINTALQLASVFSRFGLRPAFMQAVVEHDRARVFYEMRHTQSNRRRRQLATEWLWLSDILLRLLLLRRTDAARLEGLVTGQRTLLWYSLSEGHLNRTDVKTFIRRLRIAGRQMEAAKPEKLNTARPDKNIFTPTTLIQQCLSVLNGYEHPDSGAALMQEGLQYLNKQQELLDELSNAFADQAVLSRFRNLSTKSTNLIGTMPVTALPKPPMLGWLELNDLGHLALGLALDTARQLKQPNIALRYLESLEAAGLSLALYANQYNFGRQRWHVTHSLLAELGAVEPPAPTATTNTSEAVLAAFVCLLDGLPAPEDYQICTALAQQSLGERREAATAWRGLHSGSTVLAEGFDYATELEIDLLTLGAQDEI